MARLVCVEGLEEGTSFEVIENEVTLGKHSSNKIVLPHNSVSPKHAKIRRVGRHFEIEDLDSLGGTFVNGKKVATEKLEDDDLVVVGEVSLKFQTKGTVDDTRPLMAGLPLAVSAPKVKLISMEGMETGFEFAIKAQTTAIGRDEANAIKLFHKSISRRHSVISVEAGKVYIKDLGSMNGVRVGGKRVEEQELVDGDELEIGELKFRVSIEQQLAPNDRTIVSSPVTVLMRPNLTSLDLDGQDAENALMASSIRSIESDTSPEIVGEPAIAEKPFLDKIIAIEWERQRLCQLHEVSKGLFAMESKSEFQRYMAAVVEPLFKFKNLILAVDDESKKPLVQKGPLSYAKGKSLLFEMAPDDGQVLLLDLRSDKFKPIRSGGAGANALIGKVESGGKGKWVCYLDFKDVIQSRERQIFEMFIEMLAIVMTKLN